MTENPGRQLKVKEGHICIEAEKSFAGWGHKKADNDWTVRRKATVLEWSAALFHYSAILSIYIQ